MSFATRVLKVRRLALGVLSLDFESEAVYQAALVEIASKLGNLTPTSRLVAVLKNDKGEQIGIDLQYYVSHRIADADRWQPPWWLPERGTPPPLRED